MYIPLLEGGSGRPAWYRMLVYDSNVTVVRCICLFVCFLHFECSPVIDLWAGCYVRVLRARVLGGPRGIVGGIDVNDGAEVMFGFES